MYVLGGMIKQRLLIPRRQTCLQKDIQANRFIKRIDRGTVNKIDLQGECLDQNVDMISRCSKYTYNYVDKHNAEIYIYENQGQQKADI